MTVEAGRVVVTVDAGLMTVLVCGGGVTVTVLRTVFVIVEVGAARVPTASSSASNKECIISRLVVNP